MGARAAVVVDGRGVIYSVVSAVYNVESYLDEFFGSLVRQTLEFSRHIEIIMVDDGSTDASPDIIRRWQNKYPKNIRYIRKNNGGQASARNLGMEAIRGEWVTFIDPDDFVSANYFAEVHKAISGAKRRPAMVSCNFIFYFDGEKRYSDTHPLKYRFAKGNSTVDFAKPTKNIQLSCATAFFDAAIILSDNNLRIDERIRPSFEDANFVNRYLSICTCKDVVFLAAAKYYYRKRASGMSTLDTAWEKPGLYGDVLEYGLLALLRRYANSVVPIYLQRTALYHLIWYFKRITAKPATLHILNDEQRRRFWALLEEIFQYIDRSTILEFELAGTWFLHKVGLLNLFGKGGPDFQIVYVNNLDQEQGLVQLRYFTGHLGYEAFHVNGEEVTPAYATNRLHLFDGRIFVNERLIWIALPRAGKLAVTLDVPAVRLSLGSTQTSQLEASAIHEYFAKKKGAVAASKLPYWVRFIRWLSQTNPVVRKYGGAWVFMDRDNKADDNAEHLYRYVRDNKSTVRPFFLIRRRCRDWTRLRKQGFSLIPFGGIRHRLLMLNCEQFISSHVDAYLTNFMDRRLYGDMLRYRFTFLQHGVTKDDLSNWLNEKDIDCFITAAPREAESIAGASRYKFSGREVVMTGFPRHDRLLSGQSVSERIILIMPTWRSSLVGTAIGNSKYRALNPHFKDSQFFQEWHAILHDAEIARMAKSAGYRILFHPHPNIIPYIGEFNLPPHIELFDQNSGESIQTIFLQSRILITDYSSVAFEMAMAKRCIIYFQFDQIDVFAGAHTYDPGYFSYESDGFGPVCLDRTSLVVSLRDLLAGDGVMPSAYSARVERFFGYLDSNNCERVFSAIKRIGRRVSDRTFDIGNAVDQALKASKSMRWNVAERRWGQLMGVVPVAALQLARAKRNLGKLEEAMEIVCAHGDGSNLEWALERAELLFAQKSWRSAAMLWTSLSTVLRGHSPNELQQHAMLRRLTCHIRLRELQAASWCLSLIPREVVASSRCAEARVAVAFEQGEWINVANAWDELREAEKDELPLETRLDAAWGCYRANKLEQAAREVVRLMAQYAESPAVIYLAGKLAIAQGNKDNLIRYWSFEDRPNENDIWGGVLKLMDLDDFATVARVWREFGRPDRAISVLRHVVWSRHAPIVVEYAACLAAVGDWEALLTYCHHALEEIDAENSGRLLVLVADAYAGLQDFESAKAIHASVLKNDQYRIEALESLGKLEYQQGNWDAAVAYWLELYELFRQPGDVRRLPKGFLQRLLEAMYCVGRNEAAIRLLYREATLSEINSMAEEVNFNTQRFVHLAQLISLSEPSQHGAPDKGASVLGVPKIGAERRIMPAH